MTVIAWDGKLLATDGRTTMGFGIVSDTTVKIREFTHRKLGEVKGAFCGAVMIIDPWIDHMSRNGFDAYELPAEMEEFGCSCIMIDRNGQAIEADVNGLWHRVTRPLAYGSGSTIAQHFLSTGSDSVTAVRETIKTDASCGGRILAFNTDTGKYHSYVK